MIVNGQNVPDPLGQLQSDALNLLLGNPGLGWTPIYKFKDFVVQAIADQNVSIWTPRVPGKVGTAIEVRMPAARVAYPNVPGPQQVVELTIRVMEDPVENNTGLTCESLAWEVQKWLDGTNIELAGISEVVTLYVDPQHNDLKPVYEYSDRFAYDVVMLSQWPQDARLRVTQPTMDESPALTFTLTANDVAAPIYYTVDGSLPIIPLPGADPVAPTTLYAAPLVLPVGTVLTWIAWRAGMLPSYVGRITVTA